MLVSKNIYEWIRNSLIAEMEKFVLRGNGGIKPTGIVGSLGGDIYGKVDQKTQRKYFA